MFKILKFEIILIVTAFLILLIGIYESLMQYYSHPYSLLNRLHLYGYLPEYKVVYEPSKGIWHLLGWTGSGMMVLMMLYSVRKRVSFLSSFGALRHWLAAHMFLGITGPLLVTFHTTFKLHGIIATSFWCMIVTMTFGILGRYIYLQIPRELSGAEMEAKDIDQIVDDLDRELGRYLSNAKVTTLLKEMDVDDKLAGDMTTIGALFYMINKDIKNRFKIRKLKKALKKGFRIPRKARREIAFLIKKKAALVRRKNFLSTSHSLLHYWHVLHIPLATVMFLIMLIHIIVYYLFSPSA